MELWKAALLGLVQGLTEFFPVSSDGHLVALERWIGARKEGSGASFEAFLHVGTLLAVLICFRREVAAMVPLIFKPRRLFSPPAEDTLAQDARFVLIGSIVTAVVAFPLIDFFESLYDSKPVLVAGFLATGVLLVVSRWLLHLKERPSNLVQPLLVGGAQVLAILPGLSRSCSTVVVGLLAGIPLTRVAGLSFLLSLPAVVGATGMEMIRHPPTHEELPAIGIGVAAAFISGMFAVRSMLTLVPRGRMHWFAPYVFALALAVAWFD